MEKRTVPYELLVRWDANGRVVGAHYMTRDLIVEGDALIMDRINDPVPVAMDGNGDFPLFDVLEQAHVGALAMANEAAAQHLPACEHRDALIAENEALIAEVQALRSTSAPIQGGDTP